MEPTNINSAVQRFFDLARNDGALRTSMIGASEEELLQMAAARGCAFTSAELQAFARERVVDTRSHGGELSDTQLDQVAAAGTSQQAYNILVNHGHKLNLKEKAAVLYVWLTGSVKAGPEGEGDYRNGEMTDGGMDAPTSGNPLGGGSNPFGP